MDISNLISGIVGALIGGGLSFLSTWYVTKKNQQNFLVNQQRQLDHDEKQRRTDREMALRREIYLEVAVATSKMNEFLTSFSQIDLTDQQRSAIMQGSGAAIHRVQLIGTLETLDAISKAHEYFGHKVLDLLEIKIGVDFAKVDLSTLEQTANILWERSGQLIKTLEANPDKIAAFREFTPQYQVADSSSKCNKSLFEEYLIRRFVAEGFARTVVQPFYYCADLSIIDL